MLIHAFLVLLRFWQESGRWEGVVVERRREKQTSFLKGYRACLFCSSLANEDLQRLIRRERLASGRSKRVLRIVSMLGMIVQISTVQSERLAPTPTPTHTASIENQTWVTWRGIQPRNDLWSIKKLPCGRSELAQWLCSVLELSFINSNNKNNILWNFKNFSI